MDFLYVSHRADGAIKLQRLGGAEKAPEVARGKAGAGLSTRCQPRSRAHAAGCARVACRLGAPKRRPAHAAWRNVSAVPASSPSQCCQQGGCGSPRRSLGPGRRDAVQDGTHTHQCGDSGQDMAAHPQRGATTHDRDRESAVEERGSCAHDPEAAGKHADVSAAVAGSAPRGPDRKGCLEGGQPCQPHGHCSTLHGASLVLSTLSRLPRPSHTAIMPRPVMPRSVSAIG